MAHHEEPTTSSGILPASADLDAYYWDHIAKNMQNLRADLNGNPRASNCCTFLGNPRQCLCHLACSTTTFATQVQLGWSDTTRKVQLKLKIMRITGTYQLTYRSCWGMIRLCQPSIWSLELTASWAKRGFGFLGHNPQQF